MQRRTSRWPYSEHAALCHQDCRRCHGRKARPLRQPLGASESGVWRGRGRPLGSDNAPPSCIHLGAREAAERVAVEMPYLHARDIPFRTHFTEGCSHVDGLLFVREHETSMLQLRWYRQGPTAKNNCGSASSAGMCAC